MPDRPGESQPGRLLQSIDVLSRRRSRCPARSGTGRRLRARRRRPRAGARADRVRAGPRDPLRDGVLDGPDHGCAGRLLPGRRRHGRGAAPVLRQPVPARRGRRDVLRAAVRADRRVVARADAARLHVRHQGPRPDDRPADRDEAPAEGHPDGTARRSSPPRPGCTAATCRPSSGTRSGGCFAKASSHSGRVASSAPSCSSTRAGSSPRRRTGRQSWRPATASATSSVPSSSATAAGSTRRISNGPSGSCATTRSRSW